MSAILPWALCFQKNKTGKKCFASKAEHKFSEGQLARWIEKLSTYEFKIQYRPGKMHKTNSKFNIDLGKCTQMQML